jgi:hypothetical protein
LNAAVRVRTGTIVAFVIVAGGAVLAVVAWLVRPPPPPEVEPTTRPVASAPVAR